MYHVEYDYTMASTIHEERIREAEVDRLAATIRSAQRALRAAANCVECLTRMPAAARHAT